VGYLHIVDSDSVELSNIPRQPLFGGPDVFDYLNPIFFATHTAPAMPAHKGMSKATGA